MHIVTSRQDLFVGNLWLRCRYMIKRLSRSKLDGSGYTPFLFRFSAGGGRVRAGLLCLSPYINVYVDFVAGVVCVGS